MLHRGTFPDLLWAIETRHDLKVGRMKESKWKEWIPDKSNGADQANYCCLLHKA
jgi:hypothetical protein